MNREIKTASAQLPAAIAQLQANEQLLVAAAKCGDNDAIEELVRRYGHRLFRLAQNITANHEDAEEVVQNTFVNAFHHLAAFRGDSRFYTWLVRIAMNEALMKIRGQRFIGLSIEAMKEADDHVIPREIQDWGPSPEERYSQNELRKLLATSINELDPGYRIVFQLRDIEGLSTDETAQTLGLSTAAVKSRLARARMRLRNSLDVHFRATDRLPRGNYVEEASLQAVS